MYTGFFDEKDILAAEDKVICDALAAEMPTPLFYQYVRGVYELSHELIKKREEVN